MTELRLRLNWPGEVKNDYAVIEDGRAIGRIRLAEELSWKGQGNWNWSVTVPLPVTSDCNGNAQSLDDAKVAFKTAWERFRSKLTDHDIEHRHHHQDASGGGRPWHVQSLFDD